MDEPRVDFRLRRVFCNSAIATGFGSLQALGEDAYELVRFVEQRIDSLRLFHQRHELDEPQPAPGFDQFLFADLQLVDEIINRLRGLSFAVVRLR